MSGLLKGKAAVVTGVASGMGREMAVDVVGRVSIPLGRDGVPAGQAWSVGRITTSLMAIRRGWVTM